MGEFKTNQNKTWNETEKDAPGLPIHVIVGPRALVRSLSTTTSCRAAAATSKKIDAIFAATDRVPLCITLRDDGPVTEIIEEQIVDGLIKAPEGTLAVIGWPVYLENRDKLEALPVNGVVPSHENIDDASYTMSSTLRYYFKRAHMRKKAGGQGVVEGIAEFMNEIVTDEASAEGGYLEKTGMVALAQHDRKIQKKIVARLKRFEP